MTFTCINYKYFLVFIYCYSIFAISGGDTNPSYSDKAVSGTEPLIKHDDLITYLKKNGIEEGDHTPSTSEVTSNSFTLGIIDVSASMSEILDKKKITTKLAAALVSVLQFLNKASDNHNDVFISAFNNTRFPVCNSTTSEKLFYAYKKNRGLIEQYVLGKLEPITKTSKPQNSNLITIVKGIEGFCKEMHPYYDNRTIFAITDGEVTDPKDIKMSDSFIKEIKSGKINFNIYIASQKGEAIKKKLSSQRGIPEKCLHIMQGSTDSERFDSLPTEMSNMHIPTSTEISNFDIPSTETLSLPEFLNSRDLNSHRDNSFSYYSSLQFEDEI